MFKQILFKILFFLFNVIIHFLNLYFLDYNNHLNSIKIILKYIILNFITYTFYK